MKFDPTKFRLPGCIRKLRQNRQMKYVLLAVAFSVLITGSALTYDMLSRRYEQELRPSVGADGTMKGRDGTKTESGKKTAEASGAGESSAGFSSESASTTDPEKQTEQASGATEQSARNPGEESAQKPPTSHETSQQQTNSEKPNNAENSVGTAKPNTDPHKNTAPDFTVLDANGKKTRLSDKFGKPVVINFWATWCPPCRRELPDFDRLCIEYGDRVVFMMVNLTDGGRDTVDGTKSFVSKNGYTFPLYFDTESNAADAYNVSSIPQTTFIDANGNVYTTRVGAMNETVLRSYINALLGG